MGPGRARPARDERGAALTLWVLLMTPVAAIAAVIALAGPQRLAARTSMQDAADDLALMTAAWRDGEGEPTGALAGFSMECEFTAADEQQQLTLPVTGELYQELQRKRACSQLVDAVMRDLGTAGVATHALAGTYSASLKHTDIDAAESSDTFTRVGWNPGDAERAHPCALSSQVVVYDAVHVAIVGDWTDAGWAAAQVWPDGARLGAESIGRLAQPDPARARTLLVDADGNLIDADLDGEPDYSCNTDRLRLLDARGRPTWAPGGTDDARSLVSEAGRVPFGG